MNTLQDIVMYFELPIIKGNIKTPIILARLISYSKNAPFSASLIFFLYINVKCLEIINMETIFVDLKNHNFNSKHRLNNIIHVLKQKLIHLSYWFFVTMHKMKM